MKQKSLRIRAREALKKKNLLKFITDGLFLFAEFGYYQAFKKRKFSLNSKSYDYFYYPYNSTWRNERAIEIPIALKEIRGYDSDKILEIGNVLSHYINTKHDIVDKYEKAPGIMNEDIVGFDNGKKYDLIIAISTFEHVGWDENPKDSKKIIKGIKSLKKLLSKKGKIVFTIPIDYNPELDKLIKDKSIDLSEIYYMKRISRDNKWKQVTEEELKNVKFEHPWPRANGLIIGVISR